MRRTISVVLGLLVCPVLASAQNFDNVQITTIPVTDNIYMLQGSGGNIGVSIGDDGTFTLVCSALVVVLVLPALGRARN